MEIQCLPLWFSRDYCYLKKKKRSRKRKKGKPMHSETNICVKRKEYQSMGSLGFQQMVGPVFWGSATLGHIILGLAIPLFFLIIELSSTCPTTNSEIHHFQEVQCALGLAGQATGLYHVGKRFPRTDCGLRSLSLTRRTWLSCYPLLPFC